MSRDEATSSSAPTSSAPTSSAPESAAPESAEAQTAARLLREEREGIDNIDAALIHLLAERFRHTQRVGRLKAEHGLPPADPAREEQQVARLRELADAAGLDPVFAERFLRFIVTEVIRHHEQIRDAAPSMPPAPAGPTTPAETSGE